MVGRVATHVWAVIVWLTDGAYLCRNGLLRERRVFTHMTRSELIAIHRLGRQLPNQSLCVEIGSYLGASACFLCNALKSNARLVCIDTWGNHSMKYDDDDIDADERDTYAEFRRNTARYRGQIIELRKWSYDCIPDVVSIGKAVDFLLIDGDHSYEGVKRDWENFSGLLNTDAFVAFHDTGWAEGVQRVVREDVAPKADLEIDLPNLQIFRLRGESKQAIDNGLVS